MLKKLIYVASLALLAISPAFAEISHPLGAPVTRNILTMTEDVLLSKQRGTAAMVGPLASSSAGYGQDVLTTPVADVGAMGTIPTIPTSDPMTNAAALALARTWINSNIGQLTGYLGPWLKQKGLSSVLYTYTQEVDISSDTGIKKKLIYFSMMMDQDSRPVYGDPKIIDANPVILQALYIPLRVAKELPQSFAYSDAGMLKYRLLNRHSAPITDWMNIPTGGAFDEPDDKSNSGLQCLMNGGCGSTTSINALMNSTGAELAFVDYTRTLRPQLDLSTSPPTAKAVITVNRRDSNCGVVLNEGKIQYVLEISGESYLAKLLSLDANTTKVDYTELREFNMLGYSPIFDWSKTMTEKQLSLLQKQSSAVYLSPALNDDTIFDATNPLFGHLIQSTAPYRKDFTSGSALAVTYLDSSTHLSAPSETADNRKSYFWTTDFIQSAGGYYGGSFQFVVSSKEDVEEFVMTGGAYDDHLLLEVNGNVLFNGPDGGDVLDIATGVQEGDNCSPANGGYDCGPITQQTYQLPCVFNLDNPIPTDSQGGCMVDDPSKPPLYHHYKRCDISYNYGGDSGGPATNTCTNSVCASGSVQYASNANGSYGCSVVDRATTWGLPAIDLKPYLVDGTNTITMKLVVGGSGFGYMNFRTRVCGIDDKLTPLPITDPSSPFSPNPNMGTWTPVR